MEEHRIWKHMHRAFQASLSSFSVPQQQESLPVSNMLQFVFILILQFC